MKLQSQVNRHVEGKEYRKFSVVIPNEVVDSLGWERGQELVYEVKGRTLTLKPDS